MVEGDSARHPCVVVVGDTRDDLVVQTLRLTSEYEVDVARCDDIYSTVVELAARGRRCVLLIGRFRDMAKEAGRLFALASRSGARCCCLLERNDPAGQGDVLAAVRAGVWLAGRVEEIEPILRDWLAGNGCHRGLGGGCLTDDEYRATEAELNALLGREIDG
jgi:hypothetical protein